MSDLETHHLRYDLIGDGVRLVLDWKRPEDSGAFTNRPQDQIDIVSFSHLIEDGNRHDMRLSLYFREISNNEDLEEHDAPEFLASAQARPSSKQRFLEDLKTSGVFVSRSQVQFGDDISKILAFRNLDAPLAARILNSLPNIFEVDAGDMKAMARAAELPALKI